MAVSPHKLSLPQLVLRGQSQPNVQEKTLQPGNQDLEGGIPIPGIGTGHNGTGVSCPNIQANNSLPHPASHDHVPLTSSSAALWVISTCTQGHKNPEAGCGEVMPPHILKGVFLYRNLWRSTPKDYMKKQVRFNVDEDLGNDPTMPTDLTTFLVGGHCQRTG